MADVLNPMAQFSLPAEPKASRKGWLVVLEVAVVLIVASGLVAWFAMDRDETNSILLPSKEQLLKKMADRPAASLTDTQKQTLLNNMVNPASAPAAKTTTNSATAPKKEEPAPVSEAQRSDLLKQMAEGR